MTLGDRPPGLLQQPMQRSIQEQLVSVENILEEEDDVPADIVADIKETGFLGLSIPEEYGGIGLVMVQEREAAYDLGHTALAFRSVSGINVSTGSQGILMDGTDAQKADCLPRITSGELIISLALTESNAGSDAASLQTCATSDGDHYVTNDTRRYTTDAPRVGAFTLMIRTGGEGTGGISALIVPASIPGIILGESDKKMGQRGTKTCDAMFDNMRVPTADIVDDVAG